MGAAEKYCEDDENSDLIYEEPPEHQKVEFHPEYNQEDSNRRYDIDYQEYEYQDISDLDCEGEIHSDILYDSDQENRQFNTFEQINSQTLQQLRLDNKELHKTSLFRAPKYD